MCKRWAHKQRGSGTLENESKIESGVQIVVFLGIGFDAIRIALFLPEKFLAKLQNFLDLYLALGGRLTHKHVEVFAGLLTHAGTVWKNVWVWNAVVFSCLRIRVAQPWHVLNATSGMAFRCVTFWVGENLKRTHHKEIVWALGRPVIGSEMIATDATLSGGGGFC